MCVNETFPPRPRFRWLLITIRLSIINFAGIARTLVAVGTLSEPSMLCTTRAETPRIGSNRAAVGVTTTGAGFLIGSAGVGVCFATGVTTGCVAVNCGWFVCVSAAAVGAGVATGAGADGATGAGACAGTSPRICAFGTGGTPRCAEFKFVVVVEPEAFEAKLFVLKYSIHDGSTEFGSWR